MLTLSGANIRLCRILACKGLRAKKLKRLCWGVTFAVERRDAQTSFCKNSDFPPFYFRNTHYAFVLFLIEKNMVKKM
jgi:hypothetical protein